MRYLLTSFLMRLLSVMLVFCPSFSFGQNIQVGDVISQPVQYQTGSFINYAGGLVVITSNGSSGNAMSTHNIWSTCGNNNNGSYPQNPTSFSCAQSLTNTSAQQGLDRRLPTSGEFSVASSCNGGPIGSFSGYYWLYNGDIITDSDCSMNIQSNFQYDARVRRVVSWVSGCSDPLAINFHPQASAWSPTHFVVDDGSCCYVSGCTDPIAYNYNNSACIDDGSCSMCPMDLSITTNTGIDAICIAGGSIDLFAPIGNLTYNWKYNGSYINHLDSTFTALFPGDYSVEIVDSITGCNTSSDTLHLSVVNYYNTSIITSVTPLSACTGDSVIIYGPSSSNSTYQWLLNSSELLVENTNQIVVYSSGDYSLVMNEINTQCTSTSSTISVNIIDYPSVTLSTYGIPVLCTSGVELIASSDESDFLEYHWNLDGEYMFTSDSLSFFTFESGSYNVDVSNENNCITSSNLVDVIPYSGDLNGDSYVSVSDLLLILTPMGCSENCEQDINGDGAVSVDDLLILLSFFGTGC